MSYQYRFERILTLKEKEKDEVNEQYKGAISKFEKVAEKLYESLKKKEDLERYQADKIMNGLSVQDIRHHQHFISNLDKTIAYYQDLVIQARNRMNWYEEKLVDMNVEVKKYEKIKEKDLLLFQKTIKEAESKQLDEVSVVQYMNRGIR
ncbi:flagellar biosynthesis chaperone FliJ [Rossellomorea aquimaris]|uniref:flagellar export protein FliJ n=1 Tax=Rossellomorea aquimaris TaxID=189382 RepID=UPI001CD2E877|nr:flagellar export protein FliJ [Rossellomorea aquimaris]MCA1053512.1 flagellar biosynthesis chaperone FliJ [Rossellomorea aquimaris]